MSTRRTVLGLAASDALMLAAGCLSLTIACVIVSPKKYFWNDELFSWYLVADPSFSRMWKAFGDELNNTPPLYFLLGWGWARLFGASELSLRLFSSLGFSAAVVLVWAVLRRVYGFWPASIGTLVVFLTSKIVLIENSEARMYGLFVALAAAAVYQFESLDRRDRYTFKDLAGVALLHGALVNTHLFGPFYSGAVLVAFALVDLHRKIPRWGIYVAIVIGWLCFLFYLPTFLVQIGAGRPRAWMPVPVPGDLIALVGLSSASFVDVRFLSLLLGGLALAYAVSAPRAGDGSVAAPAAERTLLTVAFAFVAVPAGTWLISRLVKPIFWDRYLAPSIIGYCIIVTHLTARYGEVRGKSFVSRVVLAVVALLVLIYPIWFATTREWDDRPGSKDEHFGYQDLPIALQGSGGFLERVHYARNPERYYFILDEDAALRKESGMFGPQQYKHMAAWKRNYPETLGRHILTSETFLGRFPRFLVFQDHARDCPELVYGLEYARRWEGMNCPQWLGMRLVGNPDYTVSRVGELTSWIIFLVERNGSPRADTGPRRP
jgi:hypothetical protein